MRRGTDFTVPPLSAAAGATRPRTAPGLSADQGGLAVDLRGEDTPRWMGGRPCVQHFLSEQVCMGDAWLMHG